MDKTSKKRTCVFNSPSALTYAFRPCCFTAKVKIHTNTHARTHARTHTHTHTHAHSTVALRRIHTDNQLR